jgi:hypothetical protein
LHRTTGQATDLGKERRHQPADRLAVSSVLSETFSDLKPAYPPEPDLPKDLVIE